MKAQFKYSFMEHFSKRGITVAVVLLMNLVFGVLGYNNVYGEGWKIAAVTLCSVALFAIFVMCIITDFEMLRGICSAPAGYAMLLPPVQSWKIILPRVVTIVIEDLILFTIGIAGVVVQSFVLDGFPYNTFWENVDRTDFWGVGFLILGYIYTVLLVLFCIVLAKSVFSNIKAGGFLAVLTTVVVAYVLSLFDFALAPFGVIENVKMFYSVQLVIGANAGMFLYILLSLCRSAALFLACSYLMERKINI